MKLITAISLGLLIAGTSYAQNTKKTDGAKKPNPDKCVVSGMIKDIHKQPVRGVEAFVYKADSSIIASGITDPAVHYETNAVLPGDYFIKLVFPANKNVMFVNAVSIKKPGNIELNYKGLPPSADTAVTYAELMPPPPPPAKDMKKKR